MRYLDFSSVLYWGVIRKDAEKGKFWNFFFFCFHIIKLEKTSKPLYWFCCPAIWSELRSALQKDWAPLQLPLLPPKTWMRKDDSSRKDWEVFPRQHSCFPLLNRQNSAEMGGKKAFCGEEMGKSKKKFASTPHPCYRFHLNGKFSLSPALHAEVLLQQFHKCYWDEESWELSHNSQSFTCQHTLLPSLERDKYFL